MCLLLIAYKSHPSHKLILAANRDEDYDRPTAPAAFWHGAPNVLSGIDLRAGGTWLGMTKGGRIGAITNYRDPASIRKNAPSRGQIVSGFLMGEEKPVDYLTQLSQAREKYNGFNLIVGQIDDLYWYSNRGNGPRHLTPGLYGLSNHLLDTPWPKVSRSKNAVKQFLSNQNRPDWEDLFEILKDRTLPEVESLPDTGVGLEWERVLSPIFIVSPAYGTRSSTLVIIDHHDRVTFIERTYQSGTDQYTSVEFRFKIE